MPSLTYNITEDDRRMLLYGWTPANYRLRKLLTFRGWARYKEENNPHTGYPDMYLTEAGRKALEQMEIKES